MATKSTKWKYATVPAGERLKMARDGNEDLYREEIARTKDAISARLSAGLDVGEQMKWADEVSYQYQLSQAEKMGIDGKNVAKEGYAQRLFGDMTESTPGKVSSPAAPLRVTNAHYTTDYATMDDGALASSIRKSFVAGINGTANRLNAAYNQYISKLDADYEKQLDELFREYRNLEARYAESAENEGVSGSGRTLSARLKSREALLERIEALRKEKNDQQSAAQESLRRQLDQLSTDAMQSMSDEYYRYQALRSDAQAAEYEKTRDAVEDEKWWRNYLFDRENAARDAAERAADRKTEAQRYADESRRADEKLALEKARESAQNEQWQREFEADNDYRDRKLSSDLALEQSKLARDDRIAELEKELKTLREAASDGAEENGASSKKSSGSSGSTGSSAKNGSVTYGRLYEEYLAKAQRMATMVVYDEANGAYDRKYSATQLLEWIHSFPLTEAEKKSICGEIGIKYRKAAAG